MKEDIVNEGHGAKPEEGVALMEDNIFNVDIDHDEEIVQMILSEVVFMEFINMCNELNPGSAKLVK